MKVRTTFVSNSSSCSSIVIDSNCKILEQVSLSYLLRSKFPKAYDFGEWVEDEENPFGFTLGERCFGWQVETYYDFDSKWNWALLQAFYAYLYHGNRKYYDQMNELLQRADSSWKLPSLKHFEEEEKKGNAYIDHESIGPECFENLEHFLFGEDSRIINDNDNHD